MDTFLLTWNPERWDWEDGVYDAMVIATGAGEVEMGNWSTVVRTSGIERGDRGFLVSQHEDRGIVASCRFTSEIYQDEAFDDGGGITNYAELEWEVVLPIESRLTIDELKDEISGVTWDRLHGSGVRVDDASAPSLHALWEEHVAELAKLKREPGK